MNLNTEERDSLDNDLTILFDLLEEYTKEKHKLESLIASGTSYLFFHDIENDVPFNINDENIRCKMKSNHVCPMTGAILKEHKHLEAQLTTFTNTTDKQESNQSSSDDCSIKTEQENPLTKGIDQIQLQSSGDSSVICQQKIRQNLRLTQACCYYREAILSCVALVCMRSKIQSLESEFRKKMESYSGIKVDRE